MNELLKKFALPGKFKGDLAETVEPFTDMHAGIFFQYEENSVTFHQYCFRFTLQFSLFHIIFFRFVTDTITLYSHFDFSTAYLMQALLFKYHAEDDASLQFVR